jgi:hypothetical protein
MCKFNTGTVKIPASYFVDIYQLVTKFVEKGKRARIAKRILKRQQKAED